MKLLSLTCLLTQLLIQIRGQTWFEFQGKCYTILHGNVNFENAEPTCQSYGTFLAELEEPLELEYVTLTMLYNRLDDGYWVGMKYNNVTRKYTWARNDVEPPASYWLTGEPNYSGQCVRLIRENRTGDLLTENRKLGDLSCTTNLKLLCEKNADMFDPVLYHEIGLSTTNRCQLRTYEQRSMMQCARFCAKNRFCIGFQYDAESWNCTYYKWDVGCPTTQISHYDIYVMEFPRC